MFPDDNPVEGPRPASIHEGEVPMKIRTALCSLVALSAFVMAAPGCGGGAPEGDIPASKPLTQEQSDELAKKTMDGMKGQYKGAPGKPYTAPK